MSLPHPARNLFLHHGHRPLLLPDAVVQDKTGRTD
jgi:hypothetical protein